MQAYVFVWILSPIQSYLAIWFGSSVWFLNTASGGGDLVV